MSAMRRINKLTSTHSGDHGTLRMQIEHPRPRRSRATKVHAGNLLEQATARDGSEHSLALSWEGMAASFVVYPPPSLKLHLHFLTPEKRE